MTTQPLTLALFALLGLALGGLYFLTMRRTVRLHVEKAGGGLIATHYALRIGAAVAVFAFAARMGTMPLLMAFAGFVIARLVVLRRAKREGG